MLLKSLEELCIPQSVFSMLDRLGGCGEVGSLPTPRREARLMGDQVTLMYADAGAPLLPLLCATDAIASNRADTGGYSTVRSGATQYFLREVYQCGLARCQPSSSAMASSRGL